MRTAAEILADRPTALSVLQAHPDLAERIAALAVRASNPEGHNQWDRNIIDNPFGKETVRDFVKRHELPVEGGRVVLYHATPKSNKFSVLKAWSKLAKNPEFAAHQAARDRGLKRDQIRVHKVLVPIDRLEYTGHFQINDEVPLSDEVHASQTGQAHNPEGHNQWTFERSQHLDEGGNARHSFVAMQDGKEIGRLETGRKPDTVMWIHTHPEHRRKGVATSLYKHASEQLGVTFKPNWAVTPDGEEFFKTVHASSLPDKHGRRTFDVPAPEVSVPLSAHPRYAAALTSSDAKLAEDAFREIRARVEKGQTSAFVAEGASPQTNHAHSVIQDEAQAEYEEGLKKAKEKKSKAALLLLLLSLGTRAYLKAYTALARLENVPLGPNLRREAVRFAKGRRRFLKPFLSALGGPEASLPKPSPDLPADLQRRIQLVAATEAQATYGQAQLRVLQRAGYTTKNWVTVGDDRVRESHVKCEAQRDIPLGDRFSNGLLYPGDPAGGPEEVCNCRCWLEGGSKRPVVTASHVREHLSRSSTGKTFVVREHDDAREKAEGHKYWPTILGLLDSRDRDAQRKAEIAYDHPEWTSAWFKNAEQVETKVAELMGDTPYDVGDLHRRLLSSNSIFEGEPDNYWPVPVYVGKGKDTIGLLLYKDGKKEMFEGNDEASPETLDLVNDLLGVGDKQVWVWGSHTPDVIERIKKGDFPEGLFVSPDQRTAQGYWGEGREMVRFKIPLKRLAQHSEVDWQIRPEK